jgi:hypothetical protein
MSGDLHVVIHFTFARRPAMTTLTITDLPRADTIDRDAMSAVRGGIAHVTLPGGGNTLPGLPTLPASWPGAAALLKELHIPVPLQIAPQPATQDPRLL